MRFFIGTAHFFAPDYRDAGMHRFAKTLAAKGHCVDFVTFGQSWLKQQMKAEARSYVESAELAARSGANPKGIRAHVHREITHPVSGSSLVEFLTIPLERRYGHHLDRWAQESVRLADVVVLECGYAPYYLNTLKKFNAHAKFIAFLNDRLSLVGFRQETVDKNYLLMPRFDFVRTNAEALLREIPAGANGIYVPQGVDKDRINFDAKSPFTAGTKNLVSVGNMLFDEVAIRAIAGAAARVNATVHVIGANFSDPPSNVEVYGELPFESTLPFIIHADVGIAPYKPVDGAEYLAQSSLKIQQYSYCGLPILMERKIGVSGRNIIHYDSTDDNSIDKAVTAALAMKKSRSFGKDVLGWDDVSDLLIRALSSIS